jgi:hypothetical protein
MWIFSLYHPHPSVWSVSANKHEDDMIVIDVRLFKTSKLECMLLWKYDTPIHRYSIESEWSSIVRLLAHYFNVWSTSRREAPSRSHRIIRIYDFSFLHYSFLLSNPKHHINLIRWSFDVFFVRKKTNISFFRSENSRLQLRCLLTDHITNLYQHVVNGEKQQVFWIATFYDTLIYHHNVAYREIRNRDLYCHACWRRSCI